MSGECPPAAGAPDSRARLFPQSFTADPILRRSVLIVYLSSLLAGMVGVALPASSALLRDRLAMGDALYGALYLPGYALALITALLGSRLGARFCLKHLFLGGLLFQAGGMVLMALSGGLARIPGITVLIAGVALSGPAGGLLGITINSAAIELFPRARANALAALHGLLGAGAAVGPIIVAACVAAGFWSAAPLALAFCGVLLVAFTARTRVTGLPEETSALILAESTPRRLWIRCVTPLLYGIGEATFTAWMVIFLRDDRGLAPEAAAAALSAFWIAMTVGRVLSAWLIRRMAPFGLTLVLSGGMMAAFVLVAGSHSASDAIARFAFAGAACSAIFPLLLGLASIEFPDRTPRVAALFSAAVILGLGIGSFCVGPLRDWLRLERVYALSAIWPLLMGLILIALGRPARTAE